jgi:tetratricopeptide (TPR) repeat protein
MPCTRRVSVLLSLACVAAPLAQQHQHPAGERLGTVNFETSCAPAAQAPFNHAMALLHSFEFGPAIEGFNAALKADPGCAMAHWATAMARWSNPFSLNIRPPAQVKQGLDAITAARQAGAKTERERAYIEAAAKLYADAETMDQRARVLAYEKAMAAHAAAHPKDQEATIFWALSLTASALPTDKTYANQLKAGALLEALFPGAPDHPGITHYIIHSYDVPALADKAMAAAKRYATIAPAAPHALHMPSHTFTRVGAWQESVESNMASADAARKAGAKAEELHAMDYMTYAYLQTGQDKAAQGVVARVPAIAKDFDPTVVAGAAPGSAGVFAIAAIPARWVLERRDWAAAARLEPATSRFPYAEAMTHFARALGAARTGALAEAKVSIAALQDIHERLAKANEGYWAEQVAIQHLGASAFLALAEGQAADAVAMMRKAADREDATEKSAVTPGPIAPARELLGEMLIETKDYAGALQAFQGTLKKEPNRFRAIYGAAKAASLAGDKTGARKFYSELLTIAARADASGRAELAEARKFIGS